MYRNNLLLKPSLILCLIILLQIAPSSFPEGNIEKKAFNFIAAGARSMGMGGAFIAVGGDPSSGYWNPAGLANIKDSQITVSYNLMRDSESYNSSFSLDDNTYSDYNLTLDFSGIDFLSFTLPFKQENLFMVHQVSYHHVRNFSYSGSMPNPFITQMPGVSISTNEDYNSSGSLQSISYSVGFTVIDQLLMGASYHHYMGGYTYENTVQKLYTEVDTSIQWNESIISTMDADFLGDNFSVGFIFLPVDFFRIGAVYRTNYDLKMQYSRGESYTNDLSPEDDEELESSSESVIKHPTEWGIGIAITPIDNLTLAFDYSYSNWIPEKNEDGEYLRGTINNYYYPFDPDNPPLEGDSYSYPTFSDPEDEAQEEETYIRIGAEYVFDVKDIKMAVRGGFWQHHSIFLNSIYDPVNYTGITAGFGIYLGFLSFDAAWVQSSAEYPTFSLGADTPSTDHTNTFIYAQLSYLFESF